MFVSSKSIMLHDGIIFCLKIVCSMAAPETFYMEFQFQSYFNIFSIFFAFFVLHFFRRFAEFPPVFILSDKHLESAAWWAILLINYGFTIF